MVLILKTMIMKRYINILITVFFGIVGGIFGFLIISFFTSTNKESEDDRHSLVSDYYDNFLQRHGDSSSIGFSPTSFGSFPEVGVDFTLAAEKCLPSVVHIKTQFDAPNYTLYDFIFGTQPRHTTPVMSAGSGVIISPDGYIVTNNHVIENAEIIEVVLNNRRSFRAELVGRDKTTDIALLKINAEKLTAIKYGNSDNVRVGEWVLAIGNPFNLNSTATHGIVSAKARNINILADNMAIESFIQTDAAINPGNSGGALVNKRGELIGINTAIASRTGSFVGYSFAIPVNIVRKVVADIVEFGEVQRAYLGLDILDIDSKIASELDIDDIQGVYVAGLWEQGAAALAGVREGDVILSLNGYYVNSAAQLLEQLSKYRPGDEVEISTKRNNRTSIMTAILQNKYGNTEIIRTHTIDVLGARFEKVSNRDKQRLGISHGVQVSDTYRGVFSSNGIRKGFIIMFINKTKIEIVQDIENIMESSGGRMFIEGVYPNGTRAYYAFTLR